MPSAVWLCRCDCCLRLLRKARKRARIVNRQIGKDLSIQLYASLLQSMDELAIAQAVQLGGRADAHDPERAVLALFLFASRIGKLKSAVDGFFRRAVQF